MPAPVQQIVKNKKRKNFKTPDGLKIPYLSLQKKMQKNSIAVHKVTMIIPKTL